MKCPKCDAVVVGLHQRCPTCGELTPVIPQECSECEGHYLLELRECPKCHSYVPEVPQECQSCGAVLPMQIAESHDLKDKTLWLPRRILEVWRKIPERGRAIVYYFVKIILCFGGGALLLYILGFFRYKPVKEAPVVLKSMVYNNPTYLFIGFGLVGLLIGFYTGFSNQQDYSNSLGITLTFITSVIIAGGATGFILVDATPHQLQIAGGCLSMLAAFAIIGALLGYIIRTQWPLSAAQKLLEDKKNERGIKLADLQDQYLRLIAEWKSGKGNVTERDELKKKIEQIRTWLEQYGVLTVKEPEAGEADKDKDVDSLAKTVTNGNANPEERAKAAEELGDMGLQARDPLLSALPEASGDFKEKVVDALIKVRTQPTGGNAATTIAAPPIISTGKILPLEEPRTTAARFRKENVHLRNIRDANEANIVEAQTSSIQALIDQANGVIEKIQQSP